MTKRAYLYFTLTFVLGIVVGAGGILFYAWHGGLLRPRFDPERFTRHLKRELDLNPSQVDQVRAILKESGKKMHDLRDQMEPQFEAERKGTQARIRQVLTPDQVAKFDAMIRRFDERRKREHTPHEAP